MLPATTLPAAVPASQDAVASAVSAGQDATPQPPAVSRTSWRDHRKTAPRDADAALVELQAMGSLWRNADGVIEEGPVPPGGIVVIGAKPGAYAPGLDATAAPRVAGPVTDGAGLGILSALLSPRLIGGALQRAGVPARAVRSTSPMLATETILVAPLHRATMNVPAVWDAHVGRSRETHPGYDPPGKSAISDAGHYVGAKTLAHVLAAVIGPPRLARQIPAPDLAGGHPRPAAFYCPACRSPFTAAAAGNTSRALSGPVTTAPGGGWCCGLWHGLRATAEDGTHFGLLRGPGKHTSQNSMFFGSPKGSGPNAHMVSLIDIWSRTEMALAVGGNSTSEKHLADQLLPALGPGMVVLGDRGFPSREGLLAIRDTGAHFVMRTSASWGLKRCGKPLADGTYLTKLSYRGRTMKARVIEFHIDFITHLAAGDPLLTSAGTDAVITILHAGHTGTGNTGDDSGTGDGQAAGTGSPPACQTRTRGVKVQVSQTFTLITSLRDVAAFPAADIAALYGDRWSIELVFCELKVTVMAAGSTCRSPKPAGVYQELLAAITIQTSLRLPGAHYATQAGVPPCRISFTRLRDTVIKNMNLGHGTTAGLLAGALHRLHADITRHPARWTVPHRPGRHFPRYTIKKVRSRKPGDIVADTTSTHMLACAPLTGAPADDAGEHPGHPCPPAAPATAQAPPRPG